jgi:hypothetical protein
MAWSIKAMTASATAGNRRGSATDGAVGYRIKIMSGVSMAWINSTLSWSAALIGPEAKGTTVLRGILHSVQWGS